MVEQQVPTLLLLVICSTQVYIQGELEFLMSVIESLGVALPSEDELESLQALVFHLFRGRCLGSRELQYLMDKLRLNRLCQMQRINCCSLLKIIKSLLPYIYISSISAKSWAEGLT